MSLKYVIEVTEVNRRVWTKAGGHGQVQEGADKSRRAWMSAGGQR